MELPQGQVAVPFQYVGGWAWYMVWLKAKSRFYICNQVNVRWFTGIRVAEGSPLPAVVVSARLPLEMWDELANGDLLGHLLVEVMAVEHHRLQNGQGPLQDRGVHGWLVHKARYLEVQAGHSWLVVLSRAERRERRDSSIRSSFTTGHWGYKLKSKERTEPTTIV